MAKQKHFKEAALTAIEEECGTWRLLDIISSLKLQDYGKREEQEQETEVRDQSTKG